MDDAFWQGMADATGGTVLPCDGKDRVFRPGVAPIEPATLAAIMGDPDAVAPADADRARQLIELRLASPKRANAGKLVMDQADAAHLPLFVAVNEPSLF